MPVFQYNAVDLEGQENTGQIDAPDSRQARERLWADKLRVRRLTRAGEPLNPVGPVGPRLSASESVELATRLAELTKAGVPLAAGLRAVAEELPRRRVARALNELARLLDAGAPLQEAIRSSSIRLPDYMQGLVAAGLRSGNLPRALERFLSHQRLDSDLQRRLRQVIAYPVFLCGVLGGWVIFLLIWLVRPMHAIVNDFGARVPLPSRILFGIATYAPSGLLALAVGAALLFLALRVTGGAALTSRMACRVPLLGPLWRYRGLAEFANLLAILLEEEVPLVEALLLTSSGIRDAAVADACVRLADRIDEGQSLSHGIADLPALPAALAPMLAWGERLSALPEALQSVAELMQGRLELQADVLRAVLPPLLFFFVAFVVSSAFYALFLPFIDLIGKLT